MGSFPGLKIRDRHGTTTAEVVVDVSKRGVRLEGENGTLGAFPFQSILSWSRAYDTALGLVVVANGGQREITLWGESASVVDAVLAAIDATVNAIVEDMNKAADDDARASTETGAAASRPDPDPDPDPAPAPATTTLGDGDALESLPVMAPLSDASSSDGGGAAAAADASGSGSESIDLSDVSVSDEDDPTEKFRLSGFFNKD